jgi:hypothetical protein
MGRRLNAGIHPSILQYGIRIQIITSNYDSHTYFISIKIFYAFLIGTEEVNTYDL